MKPHLKNDLVMMGILVLVLVLLLTGYRIFRKDGSTVVIRQSGSVTAAFSLEKDTEYLIKTGDHYNHLVIKDGKVSIDEADCPNQLCVKRGAIRYQGESIICLPHEVVIEIEGPETGALDGITGGTAP